MYHLQPDNLFCRRESEHNAYTMYLLLKKDSEADSYVENNQRSFFDNRYKSNNGTNRIEQKGDSSRDNSYKYEKSYRQPKPYENDNVNWRSEVNNRNKQQSNRYNSNRRYDRYSRNNRYDDYEEDEPEWFSNGPISMHDIIDLGGFEEDDENYNSKKKEENFSSNSSDVDNSVNNSIKNNSNALELSLLDSSFFNLTNASSDSQDINDISLKIFDQLNSSSTSSRAGKWFKSNKDADANADGSFHNKHSANQNSSIMDLFQNKNIDLSKLPRPPVPNMKSELSKAVSVAELEASIFNSPNNKSANISRDSQPDMLSMLFASSLNQEPKPNNPSKPSLNDTNSSTPNSNSDVLVEPSLSNNLQNISELNKMLYSSIHKMNPPPSSKPFTAVNNSIPFNFEQLHQKQHLQFPYPYYPGVSPHFIPNNPSRHPNIMPNYALLSNFPNNSAPPQHIPPQFMLNHTMSSTSVANKPCINASNDVNRPKQDNSITNKLLKNMKFTPTSVFRKLKEHDPTKAKQSSKPECESVTKLFDDDKSLNNSLETLFASVKSQSNSSETSKPPGLDGNICF